MEKEEVFSKMLEGRRGGYCMEHALLSREALAALGFKTEAILARVYFGPTTDSAMAQTHCATVVHIDGGEYLFDAGFGRATPTIPVRLDAGSAEQKGPFGTYRVRPAAEARDAVGAQKMGDDVIFVLESGFGDAWVPCYGFVPRPVVNADVIAMNWFVCTYPGGLFSSNLLCATWGGDYRVTCFNKHFKKVDEHGTTEADVACRDDVQRWLCTEMGLGLDATMVDAVWDRLSKQ
jgi:arylamine N-acetyltransferase